MTFDLHRALGHPHEIAPGDETGREHRRHAHRGENRQPDLELVALGLVMRLVAGPVPELDDAVGSEEIDEDEDDAADDESDVDRRVDEAPLGGELGEGPGAQEMKEQRAHDEQDQHDGQDNWHISPQLHADTAVPAWFYL